MEKVRKSKWVNKTGTPTYNTWKSMIGRTRSNKNYIKKGITVCSRWASYDLFVEDMGIRPEGTTLDRIDSNGNYEVGNCRWADMRVQQNNKYGLTEVTKDGKSMTIGEWCFELKLSNMEMSKVYKRHSKYGATTFDELFCDNLYSLRKSLEDHECLVCGTDKSSKWRLGTCHNCYHRAMRYYKKTGGKIDIAGYATLSADRCSK